MTSHQINRRNYLKLTFYTLGAGMLPSCTSCNLAETKSPVIYFPENYIKDTSMTDKILVTYASRTGFTGGVAEAICKTLTENGIPVELSLMENVRDISSYRAVIAGSAIQDRQWLPEAIQFVQTHKEILSEKPFATFLVCMTLAMSNADNYLPGVTEWMDPVRKLVKPISEGYFAGGLDIAKISRFGDRIKFRLSVLSGVWKEGDHRDWNTIRAWAINLKPELEK